MPDMQIQPAVANDVNLEIHPESRTIKTRQSTTHSTIGDLHGNAIKLIYFLILEGVLQLQNGTRDYQELLRIYNTNANELTKKDIVSFATILKNADVNNQGMVRLIGDEFADRGQNDYFTLKVLERLGMAGMRMEILLSNHGFEFLASYHSGNYTDFIQDNTPLCRQDCKSFTNLGILLEKNVVTREEIQRIVKKYYIPNLRAMSASIIRGDSVSHVFYTHAPVGLETAKQLATWYHIPYDDSTDQAWCQTLYKIDNQVSLELRDPAQVFKLHELLLYLVDINVFGSGAKEVPFELTAEQVQHFNSEALTKIHQKNVTFRDDGSLAIHPLIRLMWNRTSPGVEMSAPFDLPPNYFDVHGHEGPLTGGPITQAASAMADAGAAAAAAAPVIHPWQSHSDQMRNLDSMFGKSGTGFVPEDPSSQTLITLTSTDQISVKDIMMRQMKVKELQDYINNRWAEQIDPFRFGFFGLVASKSANVKITAATQIIDLIQGNRASLSRDEIAALQDGRLGWTVRGALNEGLILHSSFEREKLSKMTPEGMLRAYIENRKHEKEQEGSSYHSFWGKLRRMSAETKISAAKKVLKKLQGQYDERVSPISYDEWRATCEGRLGRIVDQLYQAKNISFDFRLEQRARTLSCLPANLR